MDATLYIKALFALLLVLGLIGICALVFKKFLQGNFSIKTPIKKQKRLKLVESLTIDPKRRVVVISHDNEEYLILLGHSSEQLINKQSLPANSIIDEEQHEAS